MKLIMRDLHKTEWPKEPVWIEAEPKRDFPIRLAVAVLLTVAIIAVYSVCSSPAFGYSVVGVTADNLLSDDMAEYLAKYGNGDYTESDMQ